MLKESDHIIARYIESGQYYKDGHEWYASKYLSLYPVRAFTLVIIVALTLAVLGMIYTYKLNVVSKKFPFPIFAYDETKYFPFIKPLAKEKEPISTSVSRYLLKKYVEFRENYNYKDQLGEQKDILTKKIQALSSRKVFRYYMDYVDPESNPLSPLVLYKNKTTREINVHDVVFGSNNEAEVYYTATIKNQKGDTIVTEWKATMSYRLSDISKVMEKKNNLSFLVTDYKTIKL